MIRWILTIAWFLAFLATSAGSMTLFGYWAGNDELKRWAGPETTPMALNTAGCIVILGVAVMLVSQMTIRVEGFLSPDLKRRMFSVRSPS